MFTVPLFAKLSISAYVSLPIRDNLHAGICRFRVVHGDGPRNCVVKSISRIPFLKIDDSLRPCFRESCRAYPCFAFSESAFPRRDWDELKQENRFQILLERGFCFPKSRSKPKLKHSVRAKYFCLPGLSTLSIADADISWLAGSSCTSYLPICPSCNHIPSLILNL